MPFVLPNLLLLIRRRQKDRHIHRPRQPLRSLPIMNRPRSKPHLFILHIPSRIPKARHSEQSEEPRILPSAPLRSHQSSSTQQSLTQIPLRRIRNHRNHPLPRSQRSTHRTLPPPQPAASPSQTPAHPSPA